MKLGGNMKLKGMVIAGLFISLFVVFCMCVNKYDEKAINYYELGMKYQKAGDYETAISYYNKSLEIEPEYADAWYNKGVALCNLGNYYGAIKCFDIVLEINPNDEGAKNYKKIAKLLNEAKSYESESNYGEAIRCYDKILEINPNFEIAKNSKQIALEKLKEIEEINRLLRNANNYKDNKDYEKAVECYNGVLNKDDKNLDALFGMGYCLDKLGKYNEALEYWNKYLELNPDDAKAWNDKGWTLYYLDRCEEAIKYFDRALGINPNYAFAWNGKGNALRKLGKYDEAIKYFDKALEIKPDYAFAWYNKGWTLMKLGKYDEAIKCFDKALEIDPNYDAAKKAKENAFKKIKDNEITATNTNLKKEPAGTYENPAKVGDIVKVKDGLGRVYEVAVLEYINGEKANDLIAKANLLNSKPMKDYEYLLVKVWVKYVSGEKSDYISSYEFTAYSVMDKKYDKHDPAWVVLPDSLTKLDGAYVMPGGEMEGWIAFEVRENAETLITFNGIPPQNMFSLEEPLCYIKIE